MGRWLSESSINLFLFGLSMELCKHKLCILISPPPLRLYHIHIIFLRGVKIKVLFFPS